jgi:hypothetical protein
MLERNCRVQQSHRPLIVSIDIGIQLRVCSLDVQVSVKLQDHQLPWIRFRESLVADDFEQMWH